jgi:hypothetical protein
MYSLAKLMFVVKRLHLYPFYYKQFTYASYLRLLFFAVLFLAIPFNPIIDNLKITVVTITYVYLNYKFKLSLQINEVFEGLLRELNQSKLNHFLVRLLITNCVLTRN